MAKSIEMDKLELGVCYYPEHWPEELWEDDFRRMREMNISVIRIAEFSWAILEPTEGVYDFSLFHKAMDLAHEYGLKVILGTPTATPPAWLTHKYPEVLNANVNGELYHHGLRRHYNYSSPKYRELCANIVRRMVEAYKDHPAVIGWQLDNEFNCEINVFYAEADHAAFRQWLKKRYGTLDNLNKAWGTVFWSQTYTDWEQVHLTRNMPSPSPNPHLALDEKRFISDNVISFAKEQADIIRELAPQHHWITTNGIFGHLDSHELTDQMLDFFSYDSYPNFQSLNVSDEENPLRDRVSSLYLSNIRSISPNFCVMEQQSGPGGWYDRISMGSPRPGQIRLWSYQSILHGTDLLLYFRWRTATFGTEIYWHGINDYHNRPNRRVREVAQVGEEISKIGSLIAGTSYQADVAILQDYDNSWDGEMDEWHGPLQWQSRYAWFKQLQYGHIPVDVMTLRSKTTLEDLKQYKLIVYPHAAILTDETAELLEQYVRGGGKLVFGARTGYKNSNGQCYMRPFPGPVAELCGITIEDFTLIKGTIQPGKLQWKNGAVQSELISVGFNDIIQVEAEDTEVLAEYASEYYAGKPALTKRKVGQGLVYYYGAAFNEGVVDALLDELELTSPLNEWLSAPAQVEVGIRAASDKQYVFLLNYSNEPATIEVKQKVKELLSDEWIEDSKEIPAYGVLILEK